MANYIHPNDGYVVVDGLRLHYLDWGDTREQPMFLLHDLQDCARSWDHFAANMSSGYRVLALDHRGHGDSDWSHSGRYSPTDYVSDIENSVKQLGLKRMVVIGHSLGGRNALVYAVNHPQFVEALVVVDMDIYPVSEEFQAMIKRYNTDPDEWESLDAVVAQLRSLRPKSTDEMLAHQAEHMTRALAGGRRIWKRDRRSLSAYEHPDLWPEWSQITCPTLIVRGRQSTTLTHEVAVKMREAIPRVRLAELEGGGHWFYQEFPGAFEATVRWFLEDLP